MMLTTSFKIATAVLALSLPSAQGARYGNIAKLMDPAEQPLFREPAPNAFDIKFDTKEDYECDKGEPYLLMETKPAQQTTGIINGGDVPMTRLYGYAADSGAATWPGPTIIAKSTKQLCIEWQNKLSEGYHLIQGLDDTIDDPVVDETLHWAYSLPSNLGDTIFNDGVPVVSHLHGGHTAAGFDGNPEFFFGKDQIKTGPRYVTNRYKYGNDQPAGTLWYVWEYLISLYRFVF